MVSDWASFRARCREALRLAEDESQYRAALERTIDESDGLIRTFNALLVIARRHGKPIASAFALFDHDRLYGRYWGAVEYVPCLHFETSYYQMIEFAIEHRLKVFEGGAQGEHKLARGYEPVITRSAHFIPNLSFREAVKRFIDAEREGVAYEIEALRAELPFRQE